MAELADFNLTIKYRPGKENVDADSLSRMPLNVEKLMNECTEEISYDAVGTTAQAVETQTESNASWSMAISVNSLLDAQDTSVVSLIPAQVQQDQKEDSHIGPVLQCKVSGVRPLCEELRKLNTQSCCLHREWDKLEVDGNGVLWRKIAHRKQLVLPEKKKNHSIKRTT